MDPVDKVLDTTVQVCRNEENSLKLGLLLLFFRNLQKSRFPWPPNWFKDPEEVSSFGFSFGTVMAFPLST